MASASNYLEKKLMDHWMGNQAFAAPATLYIALFTVVPDDDGTGGTEVSGGSYARVAKTNNNTNFPDMVADSGEKKNGTAITFPAPTANWGTIVGFGIYDASSGGNLLLKQTMASVTVSNGDPAPAFSIDALVVTCD